MEAKTVTKKHKLNIASISRSLSNRRRKKAKQNKDRNGGVTLCKPGNDPYHHVILNGLMICYMKQRMEITNIVNELSDLGATCMVIKGDIALQENHDRDHEAINWSVWDCSVYGIYSVITLQYKTVRCLEKGNMNNKDIELVENVLSKCRDAEHMNVREIAKALKEQGSTCMVLRESDEYQYYKNNDVNASWSEWICADYGKYMVVMLKICIQGL